MSRCQTGLTLLLNSCRRPGPPSQFQKRCGSSPFQLSQTSEGHQVLTGWKVGTVLLFVICFLFVIRYIAVTHDAHIQVWRTPNHLVREFAPFNLHRTYTGHHDEVLSIQWSPDSQCVFFGWFAPYIYEKLIDASLRLRET